jgi:DNA-directed RNA polymerase subunit M/transcription elongation factor TFIIS
MKCILCGDSGSIMCVDEDGEEHVFECTSCKTVIFTKNREAYNMMINFVLSWQQLQESQKEVKEK